MQKATQVVSRPYSSVDLLVDGPQWRRANRKVVRQAKGFLHISSWGWHNDEDGRWLTQQIVARKLGMEPDVLAKQLQRASLPEIRDERLAQALAKKRGLARGEARRQLASLPEEQRRQLVAQLLEPLEVKVLLGNMVHKTQMRLEQLLRTGTWHDAIVPALRAVGAEVVLENAVVENKTWAVKPANAWAIVPHAKLVLTADEGMTGGMNFGHHYLQRGPRNLDWHDAAVRVRGEIVGDLNQSFIQRWNDAVGRNGGGTPINPRRKARDGTDFYFADPPAGLDAGKAMVVGTNNQLGEKPSTYSYRTALMTTLASVRERFSMMTPYLSSPLLVKQLVRTAERLRAEGRDPAKITVIITGATDTP